MKHILHKSILYGFYLLALITPLISTRFTSEHYEMSKMFFVYFLGVSVIFLHLFSLLVLDKKSYKVPNALVILIFIISLVSTLFSTHVYTSVWGYFSRFNGGLASLIVFIGLMTVFINEFSSHEKRNILDFSILSLLPVSVGTLTQIGNLTRVTSTFGQPNWLAAYYVLLIPLLVKNIVNEKNKKRLYLWVFILVISLTSFLLTSSLSGYLGLGVSALYFAYKFRDIKHIKLDFVIGILVVSIAIFARADFIKARFLDAITINPDPQSYRVSDPGFIRAGMWLSSINMATDSAFRFIIGYGPETYVYNVPFFRNNMLNYSSEWDYILNKPHNYYLELLIEVGIIGLVAYLLVFLRALKTKDFYLKMSLIGYMASLFFGWPTVYTDLVFWLIIALMLPTKSIFLKR